MPPLLSILTLTVVICADLKRLVPSHDQADLLMSLVLQNSNVTSSSLLPLFSFLVESEKLGSPEEDRPT
jgi:hypothetical protein